MQNPTPKYKRVLLKLSGEALMGPDQFGINRATLSGIVQEIKSMLDLGVELGVVVGGGNIFRGLQGAGRGFDRVKGDQMGMLATIINSLALQSALENDGVRARVLTSIRMEPLEVILSRYTQEKTELAFRLRTQTENKAKVSGLQEELNVRRTESERWAKLNELAGSADGAKFRRIAQGYTLDILLNYANVQLRELTRRYRLERVPETLALQVIDRDMCDEVRTVHSLSGGESFLVSLALALGLSSLSSNRMRVESLFIDEGFGSLDAETLRVAMDALESLRTQGRKIGVISHVQEMTERIPVRICVNRAGNGRSFLEVL